MPAQVGSTYRLIGAVPGDGAPPPGSTVTVREIVPAAEKGANALNAQGRTPEAQAEIAALVDRQRRKWLEVGGQATPVGPKSTELLVAAAQAVGVNTQASLVATGAPVGHGTGDQVALDQLSALHAAEYEEAVASYQADAIVVTWPVPVAVYENGEYRAGTLHRAWAVAVDEFDTLFEED